MTKIKGFKGFDKDLKCRGFQYEVGKDYTQGGVIHCCESGFHFCEDPLKVFEYYKPSSSRYCEVEGDGETNQDGGKVVVSHIHIGEEIGLNEMVDAAVELILEKAKRNEALATNTGNCSAATNTGYCSAATNTGNYSAATSTGDCSAAMNTGNYSVATISGKDSVAIVTGKGCKAAGALGCWMVLTERDEDMHIVGMETVRVDGERIKANVYYTLKNGEIIEAND